MNTKQLTLTGGAEAATLAAAASTGITPAAVNSVAGAMTLLAVVRRARAIGGMAAAPEREGPTGLRKLSSLTRRNSRAQPAAGPVMPMSLIGVPFSTAPAAAAATAGLAALCYTTSRSARLPGTP